MKILVTGGAGFIASHIVDKLIDLGHSVVIIDDLSSGKIENINKKAKICKISIIEEGIEEIFKEEKFDIVNHHAAQIDVRKSVSDPLFDAKVNILGSLNILENCVKYNIKKVIFASSGGVIYGEPEFLPVDESYPEKPLSPYGVTKHCVEKYLYYYKETYNINYVSLRYGNVYGPRQDPYGEAGVVAIFLNTMLNGKTPNIYGDGEQLRDYIYIDDVVSANIMAMEKDINEAINIGTGIGTSVNELYRILSDIIGFNNQPIYAPSRTGELRRVYLNSDRAKGVLGWIPNADIESSLKKTAEYFSAINRTATCT